jgi:hypothetical protein
MPKITIPEGDWVLLRERNEKFKSGERRALFEVRGDVLAFECEPSLMRSRTAGRSFAGGWPGASTQHLVEETPRQDQGSGVAIIPRTQATSPPFDSRSCQTLRYIPSIDTSMTT